MPKYPMKKSARKKFHQNSPRKLPRFILGIFLAAGALLALFVFFNPLVLRLNLKEQLEKNKVASTVYDRNNQPVVDLYAKTRLWIPISQIPKKLQQAFVATEDYRFYEHKGIDFRGILRALYWDIKKRSTVQGGSTITQQLVKNLFFTQEKQFLRKLWEMAYSIRIEQQYTKDQILELYLNSIYLGHGSWGVQGASEVYFGKPARDLNTEESALLAALARSPEYYSPFRHPKATLRRRNLVLQLMKEHGYLKEPEVKRLANKPLKNLKAPGGTFVGAYFTDYVIDKIKEKTNLSENYIRTSGLKIYTTMDRSVQSAAENALKILPEAGPDRWGITQPQGALVAMDPKNGEILAMVGAKRYSPKQINRAYQIYRQPGSAIKPFLYAAAVEAGYRPETRLVDEPLEINVNGTLWKPQNYDNKFRGSITLREALEDSVNTIAVQLVQKLGPHNVFLLAEKMGLESLVSQGVVNDVGFAPLALGGLTKGVTLLEITGAYSSLANEGIRSIPYGILRVYNHSGKLILQGEQKQEQVIQPETASILTSMMEGVISRGTGIRANIGIKAAGKTGTTNLNTNGWFIGYTSDLLTGVWIGNDQANKPLVVDGVALGSGMASEIWGQFMRRVSTRPVSLRTD